MGTQHFRLIFQRSQTRDSPPVFQLLVAADMSADFIALARHYGRWRDIVFADPKLEEARALRAAEAEARARERRRGAPPLMKSLSDPLAFTAWLAGRAVKLIAFGPPRLFWWIWCAIAIQRGRILRLRELEAGKIIAARTLTEIQEAEAQIRQTTDDIEAYLRDAARYDGRAFEPERAQRRS